MRYLLPAFPLYLAYARFFEGKARLLRGVIAVMLFFRAIFVLFFGRFYWVS
jgi:hypothetical protein